MSKTAAIASTPNPDVFPNSGVCLIEDVLPGVGQFRGSGVVIGPHTILTASHVLWDADSGVGASSAEITLGSEVVSGRMSFHYNRIDDRDDSLSRTGSARDFAIITTARDLSRFGAFDIATDFSGGAVNVSGYPAVSGLRQVKTKGSVTPGVSASVLNYDGFSLAPGYSGGPIWTNRGTSVDPDPAVAGLVSTTRWGTQLTQADVRQIRRWEAADTGLYTDAAASSPVDTATARSLASDVQASAAAFITGQGAISPGIDSAHVTTEMAAPHHATDLGLFAGLNIHDSVGSPRSSTHRG